MTTHDALQILGLAPGASPAQLRRAYRKLALVWHPDRHATDPKRRREAEDRFKTIGAAYDLLKRYGTGAQAADPGPTPRPTQAPPPGRRPPRPRAPTPSRALPEVPWYARPVTYRTVLIVWSVLQLLGMLFGKAPRLTEPPPLPRASQPAAGDRN